MTMWRKNMLAVCVEDFQTGPIGLRPEFGNIYRVVSVDRGPGEDGGVILALEFKETGPLDLWNAERFRPAALDWQTETQTNSVKIADLLRVSA